MREETTTGIKRAGGELGLSEIFETRRNAHCVGGALRLWSCVTRGLCSCLTAMAAVPAVVFREGLRGAYRGVRVRRETQAALLATSQTRLSISTCISEERERHDPAQFPATCTHARCMAIYTSTDAYVCRYGLSRVFVYSWGRKSRGSGWQRDVRWGEESFKRERSALVGKTKLSF